jgi:hypothetical protein
VLVSLHRDVPTPDDLRRVVADAIAATVAAVVADAGITSVALDVDVVDEARSTTYGPLGIHVDGRRVWFNVEDIVPVAAEGLGAVPGPATEDMTAFGDDPERFAAWCAEVVAVAMRSSAPLLLTDDVAAAMGVPSWAVRPLRLALRAGRSISDWEGVTAGWESVDRNDQVIEVAEALIADDARSTLVILAADDLLHDLLMGADHARDAGAPFGVGFGALRDDLLATLGFAPLIEVRPDRALPPGTYRLAAGLRWSTARRGIPLGCTALDPLDADQLATWPATWERVRLPGTRGKLGAIAPPDTDALPDEARTMWDGLDFVALGVLVDVWFVAPALVDVAVTTELVTGEWDRPVLVGLLEDTPGTAALTAALRQLVATGMPIGDSAVMEAAVGGGTRAELVARMRAAVPFRVLERASPETDVLVAYLLATDLDEPLRRVGADLDSEEAVVKAIAEKLASLAPGVRRPALLTTTEHRAQLNRLTARRFPSLGVVSFDELPLTANVQPADRISVAQP